MHIFFFGGGGGGGGGGKVVGVSIIMHEKKFNKSPELTVPLAS